MILLAILAELAAATAPKVELASPSDCAILVAVGRSEVAWGTAGPNQPFVDEGPLPDGTIYRQACDWKGLGVGAPRIVVAWQVGPSFAVDKPTYANGGRTARVDVSFISWAGPGTAPFVSIRNCTLRKAVDRWRLLQCKPGAIT